MREQHVIKVLKVTSSGVTGVSGQFDRGDAVVIRGPDEEELGRGLSAYARRDAERIIGHKSREISQILGYRGRTELIHRDDMALMRKRTSSCSPLRL